MPRAQPLGERVVALWRKEYDARGEEAAFTEKQPSQTEALEKRIAELERFCGKLALEGRDPKKRAREIPLGRRHSMMIALLEEEHPQMPLVGLCELFGVSRSWYYERCVNGPKEAEHDVVALRDAIERIVLEFPGYGYRRVTKALHRDGWTGSTTRKSSCA